MAAEIKFKSRNGRELFSFHDGYDGNCLARVAGIHYVDVRKLGGATKFFLRLAKITDKQIKQYVQRIGGAASVQILTQKRESIRDNFGKIKKAYDKLTFWSV